MSCTGADGSIIERVSRQVRRHVEGLAIAAAAILLLLAFLPSGPAPAQENETPSIRTTTNEVLLDFVVRDKNEKIIRDLKPDEIEVYEDGAPQKLRHFEFIDGRTVENSLPETAAAPAPPSATPAANASVAPKTVNELRDISVVSIVIANLDPRMRALTVDAMKQFVENELKPNVYVGVFTLGEPGINYVTTYTNDPNRISAAVAQATGSAMATQLTSLNQGSISDSGMFDSGVSGSTSTPTGMAPGESSVNTPSQAGAGADVTAELDTSWGNEMHDVYQNSMMTLGPLRNFVNAQAGIPGRKVVLLFMAGLPMTPDTIEMMNGVISAANRANVTFYAISPVLGYGNLNHAKQALSSAANYSKNQQLARLAGGNMAVTPGEAKALDIAEYSIQANPVNNMANLAEATGGKLLPPTLDMREPLRKVMEDVQTHYELAYSPTNTAMDGNFRKIEVKVKRRGATVFARDGYYALPILNGQQIYPFELATLKAINTRPDLHQFDFHTTTLEFRPGAVRNQYDFVFQAPTKDLTVKDENGWAKVHVCVTALVKNDKGEIVDKISKDIPYDLPIATKAEMEKGTVSFTAPFLLPPGHYTIDTAAVDRQSMRASVSRSSLDVYQDAGFTMSDVAVARRVDALDGPPNAFNPLEARGATITPELGNVITPDTAGALEFYAIAYPPAPVNAPVNVSFEIYQDGKLVMKSPLSPVPLDKNGAASILAKLPAGKLVPGGHFEADVLFEYKGERLMKKVEFTLAGGGVASSQ
ncbi:MAG: VWA domain-containing protein [Terracidiphilus sp.]